jgi:hypothetical protein
VTALQIKLAVYGGLALFALWFTTRPRQPTASVELGVGTVDGVYGNDIYYSAGPGGPGVNTPGPANPAVNNEMRALIDRSNAAIAADDADGGTEVQGVQ